METVVRNVRDLRDNERSVAEQLVGHSLRENQKLVIQVVNLELAPERSRNGTTEGKLPEWCNVYAGLTDEDRRLGKDDPNPRRPEPPFRVTHAPVASRHRHPQ